MLSEWIMLFSKVTSFEPKILEPALGFLLSSYWLEAPLRIVDIAPGLGHSLELENKTLLLKKPQTWDSSHRLI